MLESESRSLAAIYRAAAAGEYGDQAEHAWESDFQQALRRAAGLAVAVLAPDGRLLHVQHDEQSLAAGGAHGGQLRQWLNARDWIKELMAGDAFARAVSEGIVGRQVAMLGGSETMLEQTIVPLSADGASGPVLVAMREISDWHRYAIGVERLSRFYEVTLNTTAEGILGIDADGAIDFVNPAAARILQWASEDMIGVAVSDVLGVDSHLDQSEGGAGEARFLCRSGDSFIAEFRVSRKQEDDVGQGTVMVFTDVTERKAAERELRASNARLREALQALESTQQQLFQTEKMAAIGRLAAGVAHEINNPLTFIGCNLRSMGVYVGELLRAVEEYSSEGRCDAKSDGGNGLNLAFLRQDIPALFAESDDGISRIAGIVRHLRTFSQVDANREWGLADLNAGMESALSLIAHEIGPGVAVLNEMRKLPLIECHADQINQVLFNLLSNAIRAVGGNGMIWLRSGSTGNRIWVEVADNGCGVAPEHVDQLFEPFFTTHDIGQGVGLGLAVAYGIVERHEGKLSVSSRPGGGSVFRVVLPIEHGPGTDAQPFAPDV